MPKLVVVTRAGDEISVDGKADISVMVNIRDAGIEEVLALCSGCCACATCHVYIEGDAVLPPLGQDENDLLDSSEHRKPNSRLSCQVLLTEQLDGLRVRIAPED